MIEYEQMIGVLDSKNYYVLLNGGVVARISVKEYASFVRWGDPHKFSRNFERFDSEQAAKTYIENAIGW